MKKSTSTLVRIAAPKTPAGLTRAQKLFNTLIRRIEKERKRLADWQAMMPAYQRKHDGERAPLKQSLDARRIEMAFLLDKAFPNRAFTRTEKTKLSDLICRIAGELSVGADNEELKQLYNKHGGGDFDAELEEEGAVVKGMMEEFFGIELGDDEIDFSSPEAMMRHVAAKFQQQQAQQEAQQEAQQRERPAAAGKRKKSAKALAQEAKQQAEEQNISQSIREVFRKLASALHPDKEQDLSERARKTALMQRANVAYGNKDLLALLELQLEVEQIDQAAINTVSEERLKYYNKVLTGQSVEIEQEVVGLQMSFALRFQLDPEALASPAVALRELEREIDSFRFAIDDIEKDLAAFRDVKMIKQSLKAYRL